MSRPIRIALLSFAWPITLTGQQPAATPLQCDGAVISGIVIERQPPTVIGKSVPSWARPVMSVILQHRTTDASALRPFLLMREGSTCSEFLRAESERLLRAQPYLADARVTATPDDSGRIRLHVSTTDEVPLIVGGSVDDGRISGIKYGSLNAGGAGLYATAEWEEGFAYRDGMGVRFINYHAFGRPHRFALVLDRSPLHARGAIVLERPLLTSHQRTAWHAGFSDGSEYRSFVRQDAPDVALPVDRSRLDLGGTYRLGGERKRMFAGPFISHQRTSRAGEPVVISDSGFVPDLAPELDGRFREVRTTRVAGAVGLRLLSYARVEGFDALAGTQDVPRGLQLTALAGRSIMAAGSDGNIFGMDFYVGGGTSSNFVSVRGRWEGEQLDSGGWTDAIAGGRLVWHLRRSARRTIIASGDFAGAWRAGLPYQLPLGRQAGVRGYHDSRVVGARRAVAKVEHRWVLGRVTQYILVGAAGFADVGRVWAGDVPFGINSGLRAGAGLGLLAAVPPNSRQTLRLDVAVPLVSDPNASYELRVTTSAPLRLSWRDPAAIASIRSINPPPGMFGLP